MAKLNRVPIPTDIGKAHPPKLCKDPMALTRLQWHPFAKYMWLQTDNQLYGRLVRSSMPYQWDNIDAFINHATGAPARVVVDVGANVGLHAIPYAKLGASVIAFEPTDKLAEMLAHNAKINGVEDQIEIYQNAVSDRTTMVWFRDLANNGYINAIAKVYPSRPTKSTYTRVQAVRLDDMDFGPTVDGIKVDTEGHEYAVIMGAAKTIDRYRPVVMVEIIQDFGKGQSKGFDANDLFAWFKVKRYRAYNNRFDYLPGWAPVKGQYSDILFVPEEKDPRF